MALYFHGNVFDPFEELSSILACGNEQSKQVRTLQISGERKKHESSKSDKWHRVERSYGSFLRKFRLPDNANVEAVKAQVENGVLTVTVPKIPKPQPRAIQVE